MSTRRTALLAAAFALLAIYFFVFERDRSEAARPEKSETILPCADRRITELRVTGPRGVVSAARSGERWIASVDAERRDRAAGAFDDLADALCRLPVVDRIEGVEAASAYGLAEPRIEIDARIGETTHVVALGGTTPVGNLMYARRDGERAVLKVGVQLDSEVVKVQAYATK